MNPSTMNAMAPVDPTLSPLNGAGGEASAKPEEGQASVQEPALEGLSAGGGKARISSAWLLIAGAVAISGGVLWGMRYVGMKGGEGKGVTFDKSLVEAANRPRRDHTLVLEDLKSSRLGSQVPSEAVKKNPFRLADSMVTGLPTPDLVDDDRARKLAEQLENQKRREAERLAAIQMQLTALRLQTVMGGSSPLARISGRMVRVGDVVGEFFKVRAIHGRTVDLDCDGAVFELKMTAADGE